MNGILKRCTIVFIIFFFVLSGCSTEIPEMEEDVTPSQDNANEQDTGSCIPSGTQNEINAHLNEIGDVAILCQDAVFELTSPIFINANKQKIYTEGFPLDEHRAVLRVVSKINTTAVYMIDYSNVVLSNVIVDGNRPETGYQKGEALIFAGGNSFGQVIRDNKIFEPKSWSALQLIEPCSDALVENNDIGPAGETNGNWSDGISLACTNTVVRNNRIVDATDGAIVVFSAPGSIIEDNLIRAETRTLLGGIHLVSDLYDGNYEGTIVRNNIIESAGAVIRIAVPMGPRTWLCFDEGEEVKTIYGGTVVDNILRGDQVQYGYIVDGVKDWTVTGNVDESTHIGISSNPCHGKIPSKPAGFQYFPSRSKGEFQPEFEPAILELALWAINEPVP